MTVKEGVIGGVRVAQSVKKVLQYIYIHNNSTFETSLEELGLFMLEKKRIQITKWLSYEENRFLWLMIFKNYYLKRNTCSLKKLQSQLSSIK